MGAFDTTEDSMATRRFRPVLALTLIAVLTASQLPIAAADAAAMHGRVFAAGGEGPEAGAVVVLVDLEREIEVRSAPTAADGAFAIPEAPPGTYSVIVETPSGAYLAADALVLREGLNAPLSLTLNPGARPRTGLAQQSSGSNLPTWAKWVIVGGIVVAGVLVVGDVTDDVEEPATPF